MKKRIILISAVVLIACGFTTSKQSTTGNKLSDSDLAEIYANSFSNSYEYMFSETGEKVTLGSGSYGKFYAGLSGLFLYSNFKEAVAIHLEGQQQGGFSSDFHNIEVFEALSGVPAFLSGEKEFKSWGLPQGKFHRYNPEMVNWATNNLIPSPKTKIDGVSAQKIYSVVFSKFFRMMAETHKYLQENDYQKEAEIYQTNFSARSFDGQKYLNNRYYGRVSAYDKAENFTSMTSSLAIGFWLRRKLDNTNTEVWNGLTKVMNTYDKAWFKKNIK